MDVPTEIPRAIRVDKQNVKCYCRRAEIVEAVDKFGEEGPRHGH